MPKEKPGILVYPTSIAATSRPFWKCAQWFQHLTNQNIILICNALTITYLGCVSMASRSRRSRLLHQSLLVKAALWICPYHLSPPDTTPQRAQWFLAGRLTRILCLLQQQLRRREWTSTLLLYPLGLVGVSQRRSRRLDSSITSVGGAKTSLIQRMGLRFQIYSFIVKVSQGLGHCPCLFQGTHLRNTECYSIPDSPFSML